MEPSLADGPAGPPGDLGALDPRLAGYALGAALEPTPFGTRFRGRRLADGQALELVTLERPELSEAFASDLQPWVDVRQEGVASLLALGSVRGRPVAVYEGPTHGRLQDRAGPWDQVEAARLLHTLAGTLTTLHAAGRCAGDLRPETVGLRGSAPLLLDPGLARVACRAAPFARVVVQGRPVDLPFGHPDFLAPEVLSEGLAQPTPGSDLYALGVLAYTLLCGRAPFQGSVAEILLQQRQDRLPSPPPGVGIQRSLGAIILALTERDPHLRAPDAAGVAQAFADLLAGRAVTIPRPRPRFTSPEDWRASARQEAASADVAAKREAFQCVQPVAPPELTEQADGEPPTRPNLVESQPLPALPASSQLPVTLGERLGRGPAGTTQEGSLAEHPGPVVVKLLSRRFARHPEIRARILKSLREARALRHPRVVGVLALLQLDGRDLVVAERAAGKTLRTLLAGRAQLPLRASLAIVLDLLEALEAAAAAGMAHGDLRPEKVFVDEEGRARLADFGLAEASCLGAGYGGVGLRFGHPAYAAPEIIPERLRRPNARTDIYALGILLYELVSGCQPFARETARDALVAHLESFPAWPAGVPLPVELARALSRMVAKTPVARCDEFSTLRQLLRRALRSLDPVETFDPSLSCEAMSAEEWGERSQEAVLGTTPSLDVSPHLPVRQGRGRGGLKPLRPRERSRGRVLRVAGALALCLLCLGLGIGWQRERAERAAWSRRVGVAWQALGEDDAAAALEALAQLPEQAPSTEASDEALLARGAALVLAGDNEGGLELLAAGARGIATLAPAAQRRVYALEGSALLTQGRAGEARERLSVACRAHERALELWELLGCAHRRLDEVDAARAAFEQARECDSLRPGPWAELAELRWAAGSPANALAELDRGPPAARLRILEGDLRDVLGQPDREVAQAYQDALTQDPRAEAARHGLVRLALRAHRLTDAAHRLAECTPSVPTRRLRAALAALNGREAQARDLLDAVPEDDVWATLYRADLELQAGRPRRVRELLRRVEPVEASAARTALALRALAAAALGATPDVERLREAICAYTRAPGAPCLPLLRGRALDAADLAELDLIVSAEIARTEGTADEELLARLESAAGSPRAQQLLGELCAREQRDRAQAAFARAVRLRPHDPAPRRGLVDLARRAAKPEDLCKALHAWLPCALDRHAAVLELAAALMRARQVDEAEAQLARCHREALSHAEILELLRLRAAIASWRGRSFEAKQLLKEAVELAPRRADLRDALGQVLRGLDEGAEIIEQLEDELEENPADLERLEELTRRCLTADRCEAALERAKRLQELQPRVPRGHLLAARAQLGLDRLDRAREAFEDALKRGKPSDEAQQRDRHLVDLHLIGRLEPKHGREHLCRRLDQAIGRLVALDPGLDVAAVLCEVAAASKHPLARELFYERALREAPDLQPALDGLLKALKVQRRWRAIIETVERSPLGGEPPVRLRGQEARRELLSEEARRAPPGGGRGGAGR